MTRHTLIDLNPNDYSQGLHDYPYMVKSQIDRSSGSCNTVDDTVNVFQIKWKT